MAYVDGFVLVVPKKNLALYKRMAQGASRVWMEHGAVQYVESVGDHLNVKFGLSFSKLTKAKPTETVVFSWIVYKSRQHRDSVNKKVMKDPRILKMMEKYPKDIFDLKRMAYGGFKVLVKK